MTTTATNDKPIDRFPDPAPAAHLLDWPTGWRRLWALMEMAAMEAEWNAAAEVQGTATGVDVVAIGKIDATLREEEM